jgi:hypothetical protein
MAVLLVEDGDFIKHHPGCHYYKAQPNVEELRRQCRDWMKTQTSAEQDLWRFFFFNF